MNIRMAWRPSVSTTQNLKLFLSIFHIPGFLRDEAFLRWVSHYDIGLTGMDILFLPLITLLASYKSPSKPELPVGVYSSDITRKT